MKICNRIEKLLTEMKKQHIEGLFLMREANVRYISGFTDSDSYVFISEKRNFFITDGRYTEQAQKQCPDYKVIKWGKPVGTLGDTVKQITKDLGLKSIGFEKDKMTYALYEDFKEKIEEAELIPTSGLVESLRYVKDEQEIANTREACRIADVAFEKILNFIKPGMTESDVALELEYYMRKEGASGVGFDTILISGKKTSLLHGKPDNKVIEDGDLITLDYGALYNGYISDMTRTIGVGHLDDKKIEIYNLVMHAQEEGLKTIKAGVIGKIPDDRIRDIIKDYEEYYYPGIGHGVGRELHEQPFLGKYCNMTLKENCVITLEPGIYIPEWGGVRIEDTIVVKNDGYEILTNSPKKLIIVK
ncbi:Xaa-Pro peptidase family protein [Clostridium sp. KNHs214]|uniref:M24 family metallopeptidase n=1 Tax=Clostridium sp. KNHs214 TaxID=1540257 RepID=UPI0005556484|nr:Xaa-Pro peptidase family protein [Clostridium sp. KNHs214]